MDGNQTHWLTWFEERHAVFAARDQKGFQSQTLEQVSAQAFEHLHASPNARAIDGLELGLVRRRGRDDGIFEFEKRMTRIERPRARNVRAGQDRGRCRAETVV